MFDTIFKSIRFWNGQQWHRTDIAIEGGSIADLGDCHAPSRNEIVLPEDSYLIPGAVDLHVHFNEPGRTAWEGFSSGSLSGLAGGVTTLAEMPLNSIPSTTNVEALNLKLKTIAKKSYTDFGLWGGLVPGNINDLEPLAEAGVMGFKAFMSPSGTDDFENSGHKTLHEGMKIIAKTGLRLALHAEDPKVLNEASNRLTSKVTATDWENSRPIEAELSAVKIAIELAKDTKCPITIVHVSAKPVLELIQKARAEGLDIRCETCPHYLLLNLEDAERIGPFAKCAPPLRPKAIVEELWQALRSGLIDTIGSDHSPAPPDLKSGKSFYDAWGGISGLQHGIPLILSKTDLSHLKEVESLIKQLAINPATIANFGSKGEIAFGKSADFFVFQKSESAQPIKKDNMHYRHKTSAYENMSNFIQPHSTWLKGKCVYKDGKANGTPTGQFLRM